MSAHIRLQARVDDYLAERRRLGFELHSQDTLLADFAKFVADQHHHGPLTVELMADWVRMGKGGLGTPETWYRRMVNRYPFDGRQGARSVIQGRPVRSLATNRKPAGGG